MATTGSNGNTYAPQQTLLARVKTENRPLYDFLVNVDNILSGGVGGGTSTTTIVRGGLNIPGHDTEVFFNSGGQLSTDPGFTFIRGLGVTSPGFNSTADTATDPTKAQAFQTSGGDFIVYGDGYLTAQRITSATVFNSEADTINSGVVNVNGTAVTWVSGDKFFAGMVNGNLTISSTPDISYLYEVASFTDDQHITIKIPQGDASPAVQNGVHYDFGNAFQTSTGTMEITGSGIILCQQVAATIFNSVADKVNAGVVNVSSSAVTWVSGDTFSPGMVGGNFTITNGQVITLYEVASYIDAQHITISIPQGDPDPGVQNGVNYDFGNAFQTSTGTMEITGSGIILCQQIAASTVFNSAADKTTDPVNTAAFQTSEGDYIVYGDGRMQCQNVAVTTFVAFEGQTAAPTFPTPVAPETSVAAIYYDTTNNVLKYNLNGAGWVPFGSGSGGASSGVVGSVQYSGGNGVFASTTNFFYSTTTGYLNIPNVGSSPGVIAPNFNSSADTTSNPSTAQAFQTSGGDFIVYGDGFITCSRVAANTTFNSAADKTGSPSTTSAFQTTGGNFQVFGDGQLTCQTAAATTVFNSAADKQPNPATVHAFQTTGGDFLVYGDGYVTCSRITANTTVNSAADKTANPSTTAAFQTTGGDFVVYGDGHLTCQYSAFNYAVFEGQTSGPGLPSPIAPSTSVAGIYYDSVNNILKYNLNGAGWVPFSSGNPSSGAGGSIQYSDGSGHFLSTVGLTYAVGTGVVNVPNAGSTPGVTAPTFSGTGNSTSGIVFQTANSNFSVDLAGDISCVGTITGNVLRWHGVAQPAAVTNYAVTYYDQSQNKLLVSYSGGPFNPFGGAGNANGVAGSIQYADGSGSFLSTAFLTYTVSTGVLNIPNSGSTPGVVATTFNANGAGNTFQNSNLNFSVDSAGDISSVGIITGNIHRWKAQGQPAGVAGYAVVWYNQSLGQLYVSYEGGPFGPLGGGAGVTAIYPGFGITTNGNTGAVTVSVASSVVANVSISGVALTGSITSNVLYLTSTAVMGAQTSDGAVYTNSGGRIVLSFINSNGAITCGAVSCSGGSSFASVNTSNYYINGVRGLDTTTMYMRDPNGVNTWELVFHSGILTTANYL
jgi:hypothetical protein